MNNANSGEIRKASPLGSILDRLEGVESLSSGGYQALCPAHDDNEPSLSLSEADDGKVLLTCHAGCEATDVLNAIGLALEDLFPDEHSPKRSSSEGTSSEQDSSWEPWDGTEVDTYTYSDREGQPLFQVVRFEMRDEAHPAYGEKKFLQRAYRPGDPEAGKKGCPDGFVWGRQDTGPVPYQLPRLQAATQRGEQVFFVEGEKDVETLQGIGLTATCIPGGAEGTWTEGMREVLSGAKVTCVPDNDAPGEDFMRAVAGRLDGAADEVRILHLPDLPSKGDVTDWVNGGGTREALIDLTRETEIYLPTPQSAEDVASLCEREGDEAIAFEHAGLLAEAPPEEYPTFKRRIKEATSVNLNDLQSAVQSARERLEDARKEEERKRRKEKLEEEDAPTVVVTGRPSREIVDELCQVVNSRNDPPFLFRREGELVRVQTDENSRVRISGVSEALFDDQVSRAATCVDEDYEPRDPSKRFIERVIERVEAPPIRGITRVPILRPDGSIRSEPGYDPETGLLYRPPDGSVGITIPENPSGEDIETALSWLQEAWTDHPFADKASWANTLALALTPAIRPLLGDANVPLCIIDATRAGSGKSLLAEIAGTIATGQTPATMSAPTRDEEWRKQITAQLKSGEPFIVVDDVTGTLDSSSLRRVITSSAWSDRILGASRQIRLPADAVWCATGNNLRPRGDMVRRCFLIRLDAEMVRPWEREDFKHSQPEWTREHLGELSASLLTLARAWIAAGKEAPDTPMLGSFETWCRVVGGILEHAGVTGFLGNLDALQESEFTEDHEWAVLLRAISTWQREILEKETFTARELSTFVKERRSAISDKESGLAKRILERLPEKIQDKVLDGRPAAKSIGKTLSFRKGRRFPEGWYVVHRDRDREGSQWQVCKDDEGGDRDFENVDPSDAPTPDTSSVDKVGGEAGSNTNTTSTQSHAPADKPGETPEEAPF